MSRAAVHVTEILPPHTGLTFEAMRVLRPHLDDRDEYVRLVDDVQRPDGYRLAAVLGADEGYDGGHGQGTGSAVAVCGFRVQSNLAWGRHLYIDDLSTVAQARGRGAAAALLDWVHEQGRRAGCTVVHLDSGVQAERESAHRLYFGQRYRISSYHFQRPL